MTFACVLMAHVPNIADQQFPGLEDHQMVLVMETWKMLESNIAKVGVITFLRLFETHPDVQEFFPSLSGLDMTELGRSRHLQAHALKVMGFVQKVVARLREPPKVVALVRQLGRNHHHYGAKQQYIDLVGPQFIYAIRPSLEDAWSEKVECAWLTLFHQISSLMKVSMTEAQLEKQAANTAES